MKHEITCPGWQPCSTKHTFGSVERNKEQEATQTPGRLNIALREPLSPGDDREGPGPSRIRGRFRALLQGIEHAVEQGARALYWEVLLWELSGSNRRSCTEIRIVCAQSWMTSPLLVLGVSMLVAQRPMAWAESPLETLLILCRVQES